MRYLFGSIDLERSFVETAGFVVVSLLVLFFTNGFQIWMEQRYVPATNPQLYEKLNEMLFDKAANVDIACYENAEFYDTYTKAVSQSFERALSVLTDTAKVFDSAGASICVISTIFSINWIAGLLSFAPVIGNFRFGKMINQMEYERTMEGTSHMHQLNYTFIISHFLV